jgi:hypothetical protein
MFRIKLHQGVTPQCNPIRRKASKNWRATVSGLQDDTQSCVKGLETVASGSSAGL